ATRRIDVAVEDIDDAGMANQRRGARLVEEALERVLVASELGREELDRDPAHDPLMFPQEHDPHRAASELGDNPVIAKRVADHWKASAPNVVPPGQKWESPLAFSARFLRGRPM